ncbi:MAG TPA: cytochrome P450 [Acidimicrobiia bacterium]|nr:cytochrome P450 [Acidimicrobiia bacterium]
MTRVQIEAADDLVHRVMATPAGHADPYPLYRRLQAAAPVHRSGLDGVWYVSGFEPCRELLGDPRIGKNQQFVVPRHGVDPERIRLAQRRQRPSMITANPPEHTRLRTAAKGAFIPPAMAGLQPRVAAIVAERLDRLAELGEADVMAELAFPMPVTVVGEMVGVPEEDREWFRPLMRILVASDSFNRSPEMHKKVEQAGDELEAYFLDLIARRRKEPTDDLMSYFVAQADDGLLDDDELFATVTLLFFAGFLTTTNLIGNGVMALFDHPAEQARLWEHPELAASAVEEVVRFDSPVQFVHRNVLEDFEVDGHHLAAGDIVMALLAVANRDPARFADPDRFDIGRPDNLHLAFAWGLHFCLGARLARMEGQLVFAGLVERFSNIEPAGPPVRNPGLAIRGFDSLPVRFTPR